MTMKLDAAKMIAENMLPNNTVLYDDRGIPSVMVRIPKFKISDVIAGGADKVHPAFIVNGKEVPEIYISKYQNVVRENRACSLPAQDPHTGVAFDEAKHFCERKGKGWHLMTNTEWAALALWCLKNGHLPRGNTGFGKSHLAPHEHGSVSYTYGEPLVEGRVTTGTGPVGWSHNNGLDGIYDLCGNIWEWVAGLRLKNGQLQMIPDNNAAAGVDDSADSSCWKVILTDGSLAEQGAEGGLYFDGTVAGDADATPHELNCVPILNTKREHPQYTVEETDAHLGRASCKFNALTAKEGVEIPEILRVLAVMPPKGYQNEGMFYLRNYGERIPTRGGRWTAGAGGGIFAMDFSDARDSAGDFLGFRCAYVEC